MPFPASQQTLKDALELIQTTANRLKNQVQSLHDASLLIATERTRYTDLLSMIDRTIKDWDKAASVPGLAAYARDQFNDQAFDVVAEYNAMKAAAQSLGAWIFANIPTDPGSGAVLLETLNSDGTRSALTVPSGGAIPNAFRSEANAFLATIA